MNEWGNKLKGYIILITYAILLYLGISHIKEVLAFIGTIISVLSPFILGIVFAYILNIIMSLLEEKLFHKLEGAKRPFVRKLKRPLSLLTTFVLVFAFFTAILLFVVPQLTESISMLSRNMEGYLKSLQKFINDTTAKYNLTGEFWSSITINWHEIVTKAGQVISATVPQILLFTYGLTNSIINVIMGLIVSVYLLATKEKMMKILKKLTFAYTSKATSARIIETSAQTNKAFQNFIGGQLTEALIIGVLVFIGMLIFRFPYALLCSVIIAVTSVIPIFGAWIGAIPSAFIILMAQPQKTLWFILFIVVLQLLEGNVIYPRVVGNSIGLDGLWVLFAIVVGGSLFGLIGILLGIPVFAVLYTIIRRITNRKLKEKNIIIH